jgi:hypothetical protein
MTDSFARHPLGHAAGDAKKEELRSSPQIISTSQCGMGGLDGTSVAALGQFSVLYFSLFILCLFFSFFYFVFLLFLMGRFELYLDFNHCLYYENI